MTTQLFQPKLKGAVKAIPSKSHVHRLLIAAALYGKSTKIICDGKLSEDISATIKCLEAIGAEISTKESEITIQGINKKITAANLYCGESGSTMRFMLPIVCALGINANFYPEGRLPQRPLSPLREELINHGCNIDEIGSIPFKTYGKLRSGTFQIAGNVSSQYITGLLFALPLLEENSEIQIIGKLESRPYVDMTLEVLSQFGVNIEIVNESLILIKSQAKKQAICQNATFYADGDWSNAAFWLAAGALSDGEICVTGLRIDSKQGDKAIIDVLKAFGVEISIQQSSDSINNKLYNITAHKSTLHCTEIDAADIPDLVPILSLVSACASGTTKIYNAQRLRLKESDRIFSVCQILTELGAQVQATDDGLLITGKNDKFSLNGGTVSSHNDHRIAMTAAIASTVCEKEVIITASEAVNKSYPLFWQDFNRLNKNTKE